MRLSFRWTWLSGVFLALFFAAPACWSQSFTLSAAPQSLTIHPGDQNVPVTVTASSTSYTGPINVSLTGLPSGITFAPIALTAGSSGTLLLNASVSADTEDFPGLIGVDAGPAHAVTVVGAVGSGIVTTTIQLTVSLDNPSDAPDPSKINLPIVQIDTNGVGITSKTTDVPGTIIITSANGQTSYLPNSSDSDNTATFHIHGNSSAEMPKKPYHVKLNTSVDLLAAMGLTCPYVTSSGKATCDKSKSYILLANYDDKTFLRDWAAEALANAIPMGNGYLTSPPGSPSPSGTSALMPWASHSLYVELYLNGEYEGDYQLIEEVKVDSHRVNISELSETDTTDDITGGYLLEIDHHEDEAFVFTTPQGVPIGIVDPDFSPDPEVPQQTSYISSYVDTAENALFSSNFTDPTLGWRPYFDEASTINFYIVNDLMGNQDGGDFYSSDYLYKAKDNPLLYMGPVWDFDISSGNADYSIVNPTVPWMWNEAVWYRRWFTDPGFKADVVSQWNALKNNGILGNWVSSISQEAATLEQSQANNFGRWPMQGIKVWPNPVAIGSYDGEVAYMTNWLNLRMAWLDSQFNNKAATTTTLTVPTGTLRSGSQVTLAAQVQGATSPTGTVSFLSNNILIGGSTVDSDGNASLVTSALPAGTDNLEAVYAGNSTYALSASAVQPVTVLNPLVNTVTNLASSTSSAQSSDAIVFTISVLGNSGTTEPTGTLTFTANGTTNLGAASLTAAATASFSTANLPPGASSVQAAYSGDSNYSASSSNTVTVNLPLPVAATPTFSPAAGSYSSVQTVTISDTTPGAVIYYTTDGTPPTASSTPYSTPIAVNTTETINAIAAASGYTDSNVATAVYTLPPPTFTLAITPSSASVSKGQSASIALTVTPQFDFTQAVGFSCSGLPSGEQCSFSPATVTPGNATATSALTISESENAAAFPLPSWTKFAGAAAFALLLWPIRRRPKLFVWFVFLTIGMALWGCTGQKMTTSTVTVTATGGSVSASQSFSLTVTR